MQKKILLIIPAFNEQGNIKRTIEKILSLELPLSVLVINDGSHDSTLKEAKEEGVLAISHPFNLGIGLAVQTGFKFAHENNFDIVVRVDGDGQHDESFIEKLLEPILKDQADMVIGSRFIPPYLGYRSSFVRRIGINFFAWLISLLTKYKVTDPTSGFVSYNKRMIRIFSRYYPGDFPEPEAIVIARRYESRVSEIPVIMNKRISGNSSIRYFKTLYYMIKVTFAILLDKLKTKKDLNYDN